MKVFVLGSNGMLGRYLCKYLKNNNFHSLTVVAISRDELDLTTVSEKDVENVLCKFNITDNDVVINAAGIINVMVDVVGKETTENVNSKFPHILANVCQKLNTKMIHITTDCVFSGDKGNYDENDTHDCNDVYGKTKSKGEPENCCVIRTSIIGEEVNHKRSLIEWIKSMKGKVVSGFTNHTWNGLTCLELSKVIEKIIHNGWYWGGVRHIHSPDVVTKKELLSIVNSVYDLNIEIVDKKTDNNCYRSLRSVYDIEKYEIPKINKQVLDLYKFEKTIDKFPTTVDIRTEFGCELVLGIPYAYWLHKQGKLDKVITCKSMKPFYYFTDNVEEKYDFRTVDTSQSGVMDLPNPWIHGNSRMGTTHTKPAVLDYSQWEAPPYKEHYANDEFKFDKPMIVISNKIVMDHGKKPLAYFDLATLYELFNYLVSENYCVVYKRPKMTEKEFTIDMNEQNTVDNGYTISAHVESLDRVIDDYELTEFYDDVYLIDNIVNENKKYTFNEVQLMLFANAEGFVSIAGGNSIFCSFFGKNNVTYITTSGEQRDGYYSENSYIQKLSDCNVIPVLDKEDDILSRGFNDYEKLIKKVKEIF